VRDWEYFVSLLIHDLGANQVALVDQIVPVVVEGELLGGPAEHEGQELLPVRAGGLVYLRGHQVDRVGLDHVHGVLDPVEHAAVVGHCDDR
jgi:hypothetical protein